MNNQTNKSPFLPWWLWAIVAIEILVVMSFVVKTVLDPESTIAGAGHELTYLIVLYCIRNTMAVVAIILSVCFRSYRALFITLLMRMCTDLSDMADAIVFADPVTKVIPFLFVVLIVIPGAGVVWLWKRIREGKA